MSQPHFLVAMVGSLLVLGTGNIGAEIPKNVILLIGDGMGFEHVEAANYLSGGPLPFELFPHRGELTTHSADSTGAVAPDSAATATAMATGKKVNNGVISIAKPGDGQPLPTLLEILQARGKATGLVTNVPMSHATPAAFAAHQLSRTYTAAISSDMLTTKPNVMLGSIAEGNAGMTASTAAAAGYRVVTNKAQLDAAVDNGDPYISGQFGAGQLPYEHDGTFGDLPRLSEMTSAALDALDNDPDGLFLMVEGGLIDWAAHGVGLSDKADPLRFDRMVAETVEFGEAAGAVLQWAAQRDDTLVLVTADHETGGLDFSVETDADGNESIAYQWSTTSHTNANVPIYAWGVNAHLVHGVLDNTDVFRIASVPEPATFAVWLIASLTLLVVRKPTATRS